MRSWILGFNRLLHDLITLTVNLCGTHCIPQELCLELMRPAVADSLVEQPLHHLQRDFHHQQLPLFLLHHLPEISFKDVDCVIF